MVLVLSASQGSVSRCPWVTALCLDVLESLASQLLLCVGFLPDFTRLIHSVVIPDFYRLSPNQFYPPLVSDAVEK